MTLSEKSGFRTLPVALALVVAVCAAEANPLPQTAQAATRSQRPVMAEASYDAIWPDQRNISHSLDVDSETPALAVTDSGLAHIVWEEGDQLYHSHQATGSWSTPSPITGTLNSEQPAMDVGPNDELHLVCVNDLDILYLAWEGSDWSLPKNISKTTQISDSPDLAVASDGSIHVVTVEQTASGKQLYYASSDDGSVWLTYVPIPNAFGVSPSIDVAGEAGVHVAYRSSSEQDIYTLHRISTGWTLPENVSNVPSAFSTAPDLVLDQSGVAEVAWQETMTGTDQIRYSRGETWFPVLTLSSSADGASLPSLAFDGFGYRHVAWDDEAFPRAIRHSWTSDPGTWPGPGLVYGGSRPLEDVVIRAGHDGVVHVAWTEIQDERGEILYASNRFHDIFDLFLPLVVAAAGP